MILKAIEADKQLKTARDVYRKYKTYESAVEIQISRRKRDVTVDGARSQIRLVKT